MLSVRDQIAQYTFDALSARDDPFTDTIGNTSFKLIDYSKSRTNLSSLKRLSICRFILDKNFASSGFVSIDYKITWFLNAVLSCKTAYQNKIHDPLKDAKDVQRTSDGGFL